LIIEAVTNKGILEVFGFSTGGGLDIGLWEGKIWKKVAVDSVSIFCFLFLSTSSFRFCMINNEP
jgi:hypothetical protein